MLCSLQGTQDAVEGENYERPVVFWKPSKEKVIGRVTQLRVPWGGHNTGLNVQSGHGKG